MDHVSPARKHDAGRAPVGPGDRQSRGLGRLLLIALCLACAAGFGALGVWQIERLGWKRELIATVEARLAATPAPAPAFDAWSPRDAYTRVAVEGVFVHDAETLVQAVTEAGAGWWVMTPLRTEAGVVLISRGFVPNERRSPDSRSEGQVEGPVRVVGLLRASEPGGGFLRANAPEAGRWYSRDVDAIARSLGLTEPTAPYFIDADATPNPGGLPVGGLTVVRFSNSHLVYALTWFGLAALSLGGAVVVLRHDRQGGAEKGNGRSL